MSEANETPGGASAPLVLIELNRGVPMREIVARNDPDSGVVAFVVTPACDTARIHVQSLLVALGADSDALPERSPVEDDTAAAVAWLTAHRVRHVLVCHAQWLPEDMVERLLFITSTAGSVLVLVREHNTGHELREIAARLWGGEASWRHLAGTLPVRATVRRLADLSTPPLPDLPAVDFPLFRAACRAQLDEDQFARCDELYLRAARAYRAASPTSEEDAKTVLDDMWRSCASHQEALVVTRASQAAALTLGWLLKVDMLRLAEHVNAARHRLLADDELARLRVYADPRNSASTVLFNAGLAFEALTRLRAPDLAPGGDLAGPEHRGVRLSEEARLQLRALRCHGQLTASTPDDPLLSGSWRSVRAAVHRAAVDTGLPLDVNQHGPAVRRADRWQHRLGVSLQNLAETPNERRSRR